MDIFNDYDKNYDLASLKSQRHKGCVLWTTRKGRVYSDKLTLTLALRGHATNDASFKQ